MKNIIELDNNYQIVVVPKISDIPKITIDIKNLSFSKALKSKNLVLKIDFNVIDKNCYKKLLKKLLRIRNYAKKSKINVGIPINDKIIIGYVINYDTTNQFENDFILAINAIFFNSRYERYNYIYDETCNYLDSFFYGKNLCDFKNNKCGEKKLTSSNVGCCRHFKHKFLGPLSKLTVCEYLDKKTLKCNAKCISCKLFTCDYLKQKGIEFKIKDILLLDTFFNPLQKYFIKYNVFTPKEKILKKIMIF